MKFAKDYMKPHIKKYLENLHQMFLDMFVEVILISGQAGVKFLICHLSQKRFGFMTEYIYIYISTDTHNFDTGHFQVENLI